METNVHRKLAALMLAGVLFGCGGDPSDSVVITTGCSLDSVSGVSGDGPFVIKRPQPAVLSGWAADIHALGQVSDVEARLVGPDGRIAARATGVSVKRPDVAEAYKSPKLETAGFEISLKSDGLAPGEYDVQFRSKADQRVLVCRPGKRLRVE